MRTAVYSGKGEIQPYVQNIEGGLLFQFGADDALECAVLVVVRMDSKKPTKVCLECIEC